MNQESLFEAEPSVGPRDPLRVHLRKRGLAQVLYELMTCVAGSRWWTLPELERAMQARGRKVLTTSISARLRDLRKPPFNARVASRPRAGSPHLVEYRIGVEVST